MRGKAAPIIIVGTHKDHPSVTEEYLANILEEMNSKLKKKFRTIRKILFVSCSAGDVCRLSFFCWISPYSSYFQGFSALRSAIAEAIASVPGIGQEMPNSYLQLQQMLAGERTKKVPPVLLWEGTLAFSVLSCVAYQKQKKSTVRWVRCAALYQNRIY